MPGGTRPTHCREAAIAALLSEATVEQAAAKAGLSYATLRRWLKEPDFQAHYQAARVQVLEQTITLLLQGTTQAVATLKKVLKGNHVPSKVRAARTILDLATAGVERLVLVNQVAALQRQVAEIQHVHEQLLDQTARTSRNGTG